MAKYCPIVVTQRKSGGHMHPPVSAVVGNPGHDLDDPADKPHDGSLDLLALHIELTKKNRCQVYI